MNVKKIIFGFIMIMICFESYANNLIISNVTTPSTNQIRFNISWENSWYTDDPLPNWQNWDAVWVFVKVQDCNTALQEWEHLNLTGATYTITGSPNILAYDAVSDVKGVFIRRSGVGAGNVPNHTVTITIPSPSNSISANLDLTTVNLDVVGIEMVYVPEGPFWVGGSSNNSGLNNFGFNGNAGFYQITSEALIPANTLSSGTTNSTSSYSSRHNDIPANFPKGYARFYSMKYEITQGQYVHFLNRLLATQQDSRVNVTLATAPITPQGNFVMSTSTTTPSSSGNGICLLQSPVGLTPAVFGLDFNNNGIPNENTDGASIACNYLSAYDVLAYLDWSALRPMSELEFEKACRGPKMELPNMYAWGNRVTSPTVTVANLTNRGANNEGLPTSATLNAPYYMSTMVPMRVGINATPLANRVRSGATFFGIQDMSGNLNEITMKCAHSYYQGASPQAIFLDDQLGDGNIDGSGHSDIVNWNPSSSSNVLNYFIYRGGFNGTIVTTDNRYYSYSSYTPSTTRLTTNGGRGVRQF